MARLTRRIRATFAALGLALATFACASPTLPLPPPSLPSVSAGSEPNTWKLSSESGAMPNALVVIVNRNERLPAHERVSGTIADERGSWQVEVIASPGDVLDVSQDSGNARSPSTSVEIR